jgi:succinate dehydrogenase hydrophobic anchor subunit
MGIKQQLFSTHLIIRFLVLPVFIFIICTIIHLSKGAQNFIAFLESWKWMTMICVCIITVHLALELKATAEDYIPHLDRRARAIKILWCITASTIAVICLAVGQL